MKSKKNIKNKNKNKNFNKKKNKKKSIKNNINLIGSAYNNYLINFGRLDYYHDYYPEEENWFKVKNTLTHLPLYMFSKIIDLKNYFKDILNTPHILDILGIHFNDQREIQLNNPPPQKLYLLHDDMILLDVAINYNRQIFICTNTTSRSRLENLNYFIVNDTNEET